MPVDYSKYPPNWKTEIVPAVLERAKHCCEECGLMNYQNVFSIKFWVRDDNRNRYILRTIWFRDSRDAVRESRNETYKIKEVRVVLTISHTDHDEENHDVKLDRLKALCQICHLRYDAKEKYRRINSKSTQTTLLPNSNQTDPNNQESQNKTNP